jgi:hypothetical protein
MLARLYKHLPFLNFVISTTAFTFQVSVLYPWHEEISRKIDNELLQQKKCK